MKISKPLISFFLWILLFGVAIFVVFGKDAWISFGLWMGKDFGGSPFFTYDRALEQAKHRDFSLAVQTLSGCDGDSLSSEKRADVYELSGDIQASLSGEVLEVLDLYKKSEALFPRLRTETKISLLESTLSGSQSQSGNSGTTEPQKLLSGSVESLEKAHERIQKDQSKRSEYLLPPGQNTPAGVLRDTIDFVDAGKSTVDW